MTIAANDADRYKAYCERKKQTTATYSSVCESHNCSKWLPEASKPLVCKWGYPHFTGEAWAHYASHIIALPIYAFAPGNPCVYDRTVQVQITIVCGRQHIIIEVIALTVC